MRIGIDIQTAVGRPTGVGQYVINLVRELARLEGEERFRLFCFDFRRRFAGLGLSDPRFETRRIRAIPGAVYNLLSENLGLPDISLFAGKCDLYHFPNFIVPPIRRGGVVLTVHDLSFARFPAYTERSNMRRLRKRFRYSLERADAIIAVSDFSRRELTDIYGVPRERIRVVHQAARVVPGERRDRPLDDDYFLFVGTVEPRKNLGALLDAWKIITARRGGKWPCRLVVAGGAGWRCPPAEEQARERGVEGDVVVLDYVPNDRLGAYYANAEALVYPSLYEGFGMPPLEAMIRGTPVIASSAPAIPEVVGDAALMVDPREPEAIAGAMMRIRDDRSLRDELVRRGLERAKMFSWRKTAEKTMDIYREVARDS